MNPYDPDRAAAVRRALDLFLDLLAREVVRSLPPDPDSPAGPGTGEPDLPEGVPAVGREGSVIAADRVDRRSR
jgi:hypothetical protein